VICRFASREAGRQAQGHLAAYSSYRDDYRFAPGRTRVHRAACVNVLSRERYVARPPAHEQGMLRALQKTAMDSVAREYEAVLRNRAQALRLRCAISTYRARRTIERTQTLLASAVAVRRGAVRTTVAETVIGSAERKA